MVSGGILAEVTDETVLPGLRDHHVHLGLIAREELASSSLSAVDDLGWVPEEALEWQRRGIAGRAVRVAGPFLTAPGGYPTGRSWAPPAAVLAVSGPVAAVAAVTELARAGVRMIKVALHTAMPLLDEPTLRALVVTAHEHGLPVVVHAEGPGQPARALAAGADVLAHTPWTERLADDLVQALAANLTIISTLAIFADTAAEPVATDNLARFHRAGGRIRYGTDLGNGSAPVGVNRAEVAGLAAAGLDVAAILATICRVPERPVRHPEPPPSHTELLADWLTDVRPVDDEGDR